MEKNNNTQIFITPDDLSDSSDSSTDSISSTSLESPVYLLNPVLQPYIPIPPKIYKIPLDIYDSLTPEKIKTKSISIIDVPKKKPITPEQIKTKYISIVDIPKKKSITPEKITTSSTIIDIPKKEPTKYINLKELFDNFNNIMQLMYSHYNNAFAIYNTLLEEKNKVKFGTYTPIIPDKYEFPDSSQTREIIKTMENKVKEFYAIYPQLLNHSNFDKFNKDIQQFYKNY